MNGGFKTLYTQVLQNKTIKASVWGSKDLRYYSDSIGFYIDWEKHNSSSVIILRTDRASITMLNGIMVSQDYKY